MVVTNGPYIPVTRIWSSDALLLECYACYLGLGTRLVSASRRVRESGRESRSRL